MTRPGDREAVDEALHRITYKKGYERGLRDGLLVVLFLILPFDTAVLLLFLPIRW